MTVTATAPVVTPDQQTTRTRDIVSIVTIYVFFLMAIPSRYIFGPLGGAGSPSTILGALFLVAYLLRWIHPASPIGTGRHPIRLVATALFCVFLTSYVSANLHKMASLEQNGADRGLIMISGWLGIMLLTAEGIESMDRLKVLLDRIIFGATGMAALGIIQFFIGLDITKYIVIPGLQVNQPYTDVSTRGSFNRPSATAIHPIEFGFVLVTLLPIAIHRARYAPQGRRFRRWLQVVLIATTLPMTVSRSAILGFVIALIVILPIWPSRERWAALGVTALGVVGIQVVVPGLFRSLNNLFFAIGTDASTTSRTAAFSSAAPFISAHPLFGLGFGTFMPNIYFFTDDEYLNAAIEIGLVGSFMLLLMFITGWCLSRSARRASADQETRHLGQCMAASCAVMLICYATFDALYFPMAAGLTFLVLGCVGALWRLTVQSRRQHEVSLRGL
jgi:O-antigen ligase